MLRPVSATLIAFAMSACASSASVEQVLLPEAYAVSQEASQDAAVLFVNKVCFPVLTGAEFESAAQEENLQQVANPFRDFLGFPDTAYTTIDAPRIFVAPYAGSEAGCTISIYDGDQEQILDSVLAAIGEETGNESLQGGLFARNGAKPLNYQDRRIWLQFNNDSSKDLRTGKVLREKQGYLVSLMNLRSKEGR